MAVLVVAVLVCGRFGRNSIAAPKFDYGAYSADAEIAQHERRGPLD